MFECGAHLVFVHQQYTMYMNEYPFICTCMYVCIYMYMNMYMYNVHVQYIYMFKKLAKIQVLSTCLKIQNCCKDGR